MDMESFIYIQRHGESETNIKKIFTCRKIDPALTENGRKQILGRTEYYKDRNISRIIASPSKRTRETAGIIADSLKLNFSTDENLLEINLGDLEGADQLIPENTGLFHEILNDWLKDGKRGFPAGETFDDVKRRIDNLKNYFQSGENVILVGHSAFFSILLSTYIKADHIRSLFLTRGGAAEYSSLKKEWKILE
jgi:broad specificity phosphatase PhoE